MQVKNSNAGNENMSKFKGVAGIGSTGCSKDKTTPDGWVRKKRLDNTVNKTPKSRVIRFIATY